MFQNNTIGNGVASFHLVLTLYFECDTGLPKVRDLRRICECLSNLAGLCRCAGSVGAFWHLMDVPITPTRISTTSVESVFDKLSSDQVSTGAVSIFLKDCNRKFDVDIELIVMPEVNSFGSSIPASLQLVFSERTIASVGEAVIAANLQSCFDICDVCQPFYGFVDLALYPDAIKGANYGAIPNLSTSIQQKYQMNEWIYCNSKSRDRARGVYWGNYFGPKILDRLGGRAAFTESFKKQNPHSTLLRGYDFGIFVTLCKSFLSAIPSPIIDNFDMALDRNLLWLQAELSRRGVLSAWSNEVATDVQRLSGIL